MRQRGFGIPAVGMAVAMLLQAEVACAICPPPVPSAFTSTIPGLVLLVGRDAQGAADPRGEFVVVVRNGCMLPLPGRVVDLSIVACPGARLAATGHPPGFTVDCSPTRRSIRTLSDANGEARFSIAGAAVPGIDQPVRCAEIRADGVLLGRPHLAIPDLDGADGVGANDLSRWLAEFGAGDAGQGDFDGDGSIGANDLSVWLVIFAGGGSVATPAPLCP